MTNVLAIVATGVFVAIITVVLLAAVAMLVWKAQTDMTLSEQIDKIKETVSNFRDKGKHENKQNGADKHEDKNKGDDTQSKDNDPEMKDQQPATPNIERPPDQLLPTPLTHQPPKTSNRVTNDPLKEPASAEPQKVTSTPPSNIANEPPKVPKAHSTHSDKTRLVQLENEVAKHADELQSVETKAASKLAQMQSTHQEEMAALRTQIEQSRGKLKEVTDS